MVVGIPKEIKNNENRVAITPAGVYALAKLGSKVLIEKSAGEGSGITDEEYKAAGATIYGLAADVFKESDMIGSVWNVTVQGFTLKVTFSANGQAVAGSDNFLVRQMAKSKYGVDALPGKWRIEGPKLLLSTTFDGKDYNTELTISGTKLISKEGVPIVRVQ